MDGEIELLSRVTVNHLILGQYEPFRAAVLSLRKRNPTLALSILQTIVARGGRIDEILWSPSCPSPPNLAWLASLELLNFSGPPSSIWNINPDTLRSKVEFLLLLQLVISRVSHLDSVDIVNRFLDFGLKRLKADIVDDDDSAPRDLVSSFTEDELLCLEKLVVDHAEIFDALSWNMQKQVKWSDPLDSRLAITVSRADQKTEGSFEDDMEALVWMQRSIQKAHINALRKCLEMDDEQGAVSHLMFLHMDQGSEESMYRIALQDSIKKACFGRNGYGDTWYSMRKKMLLIYAKAIASNNTELVQMIQVLDDQLLSEEIELHRVSDAHSIPPPLRRLQEYLETSNSAVKEKLDDRTPYHTLIKCCLRDMFHYARVNGLHILECVMDAALSAVKREELQEASDFLSLFPHLRPLVAVMGWDLLSGKTVPRRKLMQLLWTSKSQVLRLEDSSIYGKQADEVSCVEHLCDLLCYRLDIASFVACANSGQSWNSKFSLLFSQGESTSKDDQLEHLDPFVENFVLERLAVQNPMRVLFDVVPGIKFRDAIELVSMQPIASTTAAWKRKQDIELMHMRYALEAVVLALGATERNSTDENENNQTLAGSYLKDLQSHLEAINNISRKTFMLNIIIALLYMDDISVSLTHCTPSTCNKSLSGTSSEGEGETVVSFMAHLLSILRCNLPTAGPDLEKAMDSIISIGKEALDWRISNAKHFIEDWEWRLSVLQRLLPLSARNWSWKEALAILRAAPSKLLNVCMQRAKYDIGEEAVHRFALPPEDRAALELAEWVDSTFQKASVEDAVSRVAEGTPNEVLELDFLSFRAQLGSLPTILLCIDVAATSARSVHMCKQLLEQARVMLSEIYPGVSPKIGVTYWDQILEVSLISVIKRILQRLQEFLEQENPATLQAILSGKINFSLLKESNRQAQRQRALSILHQMIEDAHQGKRQFLSGKLHNLARAIGDEEMDGSFIREEGGFTDKKVHPSSDKGGVFGLGFKPKRPTSSSSIGENNAEPSVYDVKDSAKRLLGPIGAKASTYISAFILYIATIGDLVDGTDTTHDFNFFSVVYEWPKDLLTRLVFERGSTDAAGKVADIMSVDFVHEVVSACVPPVYPPRTGHGWASIPIQPPFSKTSLNNNLLSPKENKLTSYFDSLRTPKPPLYPLQLNVVKHLAKLSPVRAVLACVFGTSILATSNEWPMFKAANDATGQAPDSDRLFYEFALDQSERFPTLNRWIQMQSNLHRVSATNWTLKDKSGVDVAKPNGKVSVKRVRESDSDTESEVDDLAVNGLVSTSQLDINPQSHGDSEARHDSKPGSVERDQTIYLSFDWENEGPYEMAVERLINEGNLMDALALSDRCLQNGASDQLLEMLIEHGDENNFICRQNEGYGANSLWTESWRFVQRLKDKHLASRLALRHLHRWDLDAAVDVLTMCGCHLLENDPLKDEVLQRRQALLRYNHILTADDHCKSWQEVEAECKEDPEGLALRLAGKGAVSAALEVAESAGLSIDLRRELQGRQLVKLLTTDPLSGGGPAEASRFLSSLRETDDALPVAMSAMQLLSNLRSKQLLVHFFLKRRTGNLTDAEVSRLNKWALGLRVLGLLPLPWQQRCSALHEHPHLILEVLLMRKQLQSASLVLKEFPSLRDNNLVLTYAAKSITVSATSMPREQRRPVPGPKPKQKARTGTPTRLNFTTSLSNLQREARRAFSWAPRDTGNKIAPKEAYRKRKSSGLTPSEKVAWEAMTGIQEERVSVYSADGQERVPSVSIAEEWMLTGDSIKDDSVRSCHRYESSPDIILFKALLSLCSDESVSTKGALDLCISQMKNILSSQQLPLHASLETLGRACHATETFVQGLQYAKSLLRKLAGNSDSTIILDKSRETDDTSSDTGSSSIGSGSQYSDEPPELLSQVEIWLGRAELLQSLLGSGIVASLDDIGDKESSARLRDRLIQDERYSMAIYTCKKCKIDAFPVWNAWGHALIRMEHYAQARVKFKQALQLYKGDSIPVIMEIINTIEGSPPVDVTAVRSMYEHLAKSAPTILDDSLSADAYLNVLYVPSTFPRSEKSRQSQEATNSQSASYLAFDEGPRSNLDSIRYTECVTYLQDFARQQVLGFMFRHGHYNDACMLFFPSSGAPSSPQPSSIGTVTPSASPQRSDPYTTDYGTIDDLCELCVGYGAVSVLENVISSRLASQDPLMIQYTTSALARICNYCETHRHFNHLYKFQVIKKDHVAAGLCCIQLFMNSSSQEEAIRHLELAKMHFEEGLSARHKSGDTMKLSSKSIRGKSASEKLTEEGLVKFSARVAIQVEVVRSFHDADGPQWKHSLFGNPNDPDTFRRRCEVAETLAEKNFDLAFKVIYEFNLPAVDIYAGVAASLAERKKGGQLTEFFRNIKGTIDDDDWDQVLGAAINVYANRHKERPDRLIDMLTSSHRKVLACVVCGRLKSAFQIASRSGSVADVQYVAHQALHANALPVLDMCKQWLAQFM
ncbi:hypothetical protein H6P81_003804 [Aristolochia fimbriata]|uniref:ZFYVE26-like TPR repeats domain-containing protein n=1 Tax=Aristolochia fimbriata TaxID=158543 RepID=A0AAV7FGN7_ARIFI|nr:hypothetical protein H6P81_003804 [Aristolochia fimbriata]